MHGLIFELKERMNSRQDQPVIKTNKRMLVIKELKLNLAIENKNTIKKKTILYQCVSSIQGWIEYRPINRKKNTNEGT